MATVYISPTGNDSTGTGTSGNPWLTISKAFTSTSSGDTIYCLAGTYTWVAQVFTTGRTITAASATTTFFDDTGNNSPQWEFDAAVNVVSNLTFQNSVGRFDIVTGSPGAVVTFLNCIFHDFVQPTGASNCGILVGNNSVGTSTFNLTGCVFYNNSLSAGSSFSGICNANNTGVTNYNLTNCTYYNNVLAAVNEAVFSANNGTGTATVVNCIFWNANGTPVLFNWSGGNITVAGSNCDILGFSSPPALTGNIASDPLFVDATNANFSLRPTSPCIGAGTVI